MKRNNLKLGAIMSYISIAISNITGILYTPIMLRLMGQAEFGLYSLVASIIGSLTLLDLGFGNTIVIYLSKYKANKNKNDEGNLLGMFMTIYILLGIIAGVIGFILYFNVDVMFTGKFSAMELQKAKIMMAILTFNLIITFPLSVYDNVLVAYEEFVFQKVVVIIRQILNPVIMLPLLLLGFRSVTMTIVVTILNVICLLANKIYCNRRLNVKIRIKYIDKKLLKEIFGFSFFIFLAVVVERLNWQVDEFVLGATAGTIAVATYAVSSQIKNIYFTFANALTKIILPKMTRIVEVNKEKLTNEFIKIGRIQLLIVALILTGFVTFGEEFIYLWAGKEYGKSYWISCIIMIPLAIPMIQSVGNVILQAMKKHKFLTIVNVFISICNVIISIPLAKMYEGVGTAIGTACAIIIGNGIISNWYYYKKANINIIEFWKNIMKMNLPIIILFIFSYVINKNINLKYNWITLMFKVVIYTVTYGCIVYKFSMNDYEKSLLNKFKLKINNKILSK